MYVLENFKALSNDLRLSFLKWLRDPEKYFPEREKLPFDAKFEGSVCVSDIQKKAGISQSTVSHYLDILQQAGLLEGRRYGKWTYYRRNEKAIRKLAKYIKNDL